MIDPGPRPPARRHASRRPSRARGLSLVEMLISLAITAMLLTATMVAIDTSFKAYAAAAETASAQASTRMVVNRMLTLVRTSIAVGGDAGANDPYIDVLAQAGDFRIQYEPDAKTIWLIEDGGAGDRYPLLDNVVACEFTLVSAPDDETFIPEVVRATIYLKVGWDNDNTLAIEGDEVQPIVAMASTMPRRLESN